MHGLAALHLAQAPAKLPQAEGDGVTASTPPRHSAFVDGTRPKDERAPGGIGSTSCRVRDGPAPGALPRERPYVSQGSISPPRATNFGLQLAAAARWQTKQLVIYTARYQRIAYPMGDLAPLHGACTDVVIRA